MRPREELTFEGDWCSNAWDAVVVLDEPIRFREPLLQQCAKDLAYGLGRSPASVAVWEEARNRVFPADADVVTLVGCHYEAIREDCIT